MLDKFSKGVAERILGTVLKYGGDFAELFVEDRYSTNISLKNGKVETAQTGRMFGVGIRGFLGDKAIYAYTNDLSEENMLTVARRVGEALGEVGFDIGTTAIDIGLDADPGLFGNDVGVLARLGQSFLIGRRRLLGFLAKALGLLQVAFDAGTTRVEDRTDARQGHAAHNDIERREGNREPEQLATKHRTIEGREGAVCFSGVGLGAMHRFGTVLFSGCYHLALLQRVRVFGLRQHNDVVGSNRHLATLHGLTTPDEYPGPRSVTP